MGGSSTLETDHHNVPLAVVGLSCRFPGGATSPEKFWDLLVNARTALSEVPKERFNIDAFYHPSSTRQGTINVRGGYFLKQDIAAFDAPFFSMTAAEAVSTDPQQRLLLETAYEAVENAGLPIHKLASTNTSCYVGSFMKDYQTLSAMDSDDLPAYGSTGHSTALLANRISWFFDLRGPSITLDTGCSGSTVAFHLACESLRSGEAEIALAGGVGCILAPDPYMSMTSFNFLSPDSKCQSFDYKANGYARGEGFSIVVLKRLDAALRDNDTIRAVVRATGINQDGWTPGITLPSSEAQASLIMSTYKKARLDLNQTGFFEAHGTGTPAGDAAELRAIGNTFGATRDPKHPLFVGSVKTNIGHLEGCAGLAGIVKCVLSLEKGEIPQNLWFEKPHPNNDLDAYRVRIPTQLENWPLDGVRRASLNCFGFGGTSAHVILDDAASYLQERGIRGKHTTKTANSEHPSPKSQNSKDSFELVEFPGATSKPDTRESNAGRLFVWSSPEQDGVKRQLRTLSTYLDNKVPLLEHDARSSLVDNLAYTINTRRSVFAWRTFNVSSSLSDLQSDIRSKTSRPIRSLDNPTVTFVFNGQGAQWYGMGRELCQYEIFKNSIHRADAHLLSLGASWSLIDELWRKDETSSKINDAEYAQPICTALQVALVDLLSSWGVTPVAVVGHSSGEIAAAYAAKHLTCEDAWVLSYYRGQACKRLLTANDVSKGGMLAVGLSEEEAQLEIAKLNKGVTVVVACINSPNNVTVSGDREGIDELERNLKSAGVFARKLVVDCAYHSPHMERVSSYYRDAIAHIHPTNNSDHDVRMQSTVTGETILSSEQGPDYWVKNLVSPVKFVDGIQKLMGYDSVKGQFVSTSHKPDLILEIGPHSTLQTSIKQILQSIQCDPPVYASAISRGKNSVRTILESIGLFWSYGYNLSLEAIICASTLDLQLVSDLPPYPWNHSMTYWHEARASKAYRSRKMPRLDLLGALSPESNNINYRWRNIIRVKEMPWVKDHQIQNTILYPAAGMLVMVLEAARQIASTMGTASGFELKDVKISNAMIIPTTHDGLETALYLKPVTVGSNGSLRGRNDSAKFNFSITSRSMEDLWRENCNGVLAIHFQDFDLLNQIEEWPLLRRESQEQLEASTKNVSPRSLYEKFDTAGLRYGRFFQVISEIKNTEEEGYFKVVIPDTKDILPAKYEQDHLIHPTTLDGMFQTVVLTASKPMVPSSIDSVYVSSSLPSGAGSEFFGVATSKSEGLRAMKGTVIMTDEESRTPRILMSGIGYTLIDDTGPDTGAADRSSNLCSKFVGKPDIELISANNAIEVFQGSTENGKVLSRRQQLMQLISHKIPEARILEIGSCQTDLTHTILSALCKRSEKTPGFFQYTISYLGESKPETVPEELSKWGEYLEYRSIDLQIDPRDQGYKKGSFSVIFLHNPLSLVDSASVLLGNLRRLLLNGGKVVVLEDDETDFDWSKLLVEHGFSGIDVVLEEGNRRTIMTTATSINTSQIGKEVVVVVPDSPASEEHSKTLVHQLEGAGYVPRVTTLTSAAEAARSKLCIVLLEASNESTLFNWSEDEFKNVQRLILTSEGCLWVTRGAQFSASRPQVSPVIGLFRSIRSEDSGLLLHTLDLSDNAPLSEVFTADTIKRTFESIFVSKVNAEEFEFVEQGGVVHVPRVMEDESLSQWIESRCNRPGTTLETYRGVDRALKVEVGVPGDVDSLHFADDLSFETKLGANEVEIQVQAAAVTKQDVMTLLGQTKTDTLGHDAAGIIVRVGEGVKNWKSGDKVVTFMPGALRNVIRVSEDTITKCHDSNSFEKDVTIPKDTITAFYALREVARSLEESENVLLFDLDTGLTAAIMEVVGPESVFYVGKKLAEDALLALGVPQSQLCLSDDATLNQPALGSFTKENFSSIICRHGSTFSPALWDLLAEDCRIVQISDGALSSLVPKLEIPSQYADNSISTSIVNIDRLYQKNPSKLVSRVIPSLANRIKSSAHSQLSKIRTFPFGELSNAFRYVQEHGEYEKVVLVASDEDRAPVLTREEKTLRVEADATYIICGGFGGYGQSIARFLVKNGARHIAMMSRSGDSRPESKDFMREMEGLGVIVRAFACDIAVREQVEKVVRVCEKEMPKIKGVINSAMALKDVLFEQMTYADYQQCAAPKIQGSWNLHELLPSDLDFFVMLASVAGVAGTRGQSNYAAGNAFQVSLCHHRRSLGLPAVAIDLTITIGIGFVADKDDLLDVLKGFGVQTITEDELHALLASAINGAYFTPHLKGNVPTPSEVIVGVSTGGQLERNGITEPLWLHDNRFAYMRKVDVAPPLPSSSTDSTSAVSIKAALSSCTSLAEARGTVVSALCSKLAKSLMMPVEDIDTSRPVNAYGVDSLVAVDVRNWIFREMRASVSIFEIMSAMPIVGLGEVVARKSGLVPEGVRGVSEEEQERDE